MEWYYAEAGAQHGPVSNEALAELVRAGKVLPTTLVWRAGMTEWQPYASVPPSTDPAAATGETARCVECGQFFSINNLLHYENSWVCARCKPIFFQRVKEGAAPPPSLMLWRSGRLLVMSPGATLPDRCVKCNAPAHGQRLLRKLYWHTPYLYLLILVNLLIYAIVAIIVRKRARVEIGLCDAHRSRRRLIIASSWLAVLVGIGLIASAISNDSGAAAVFGVFLLLGGAIFGLLKGPLISTKRIDDQSVWIRGVCPAFLDTLPEWKDGV